MKKFLNSVQWLNVLAMAAQALNNVTGAVPVLATNPYVLVAQGVLAAVLPSLSGIGHKIAFGEAQDPAKR